MPVAHGFAERDNWKEKCRFEYSYHFPIFIMETNRTASTNGFAGMTRTGKTNTETECSETANVISNTGEQPTCRIDDVTVSEACADDVPYMSVAGVTVTHTGTDEAENEQREITTFEEHCPQTSVENDSDNSTHLHSGNNPESSFSSTQRSPASREIHAGLMPGPSWEESGLYRVKPSHTRGLYAVLHEV